MKTTRGMTPLLLANWLGFPWSSVEVTAPGCSWAPSWRMEAATGSPCSFFFFLKATSFFFPLNRLSRAPRPSLLFSLLLLHLLFLLLPLLHRLLSWLLLHRFLLENRIVRGVRRAHPRTLDFAEPVPNRFFCASLLRGTFNPRALRGTTTTGLCLKVTRYGATRAIFRGCNAIFLLKIIFSRDLIVATKNNQSMSFARTNSIQRITQVDVNRSKIVFSFWFFRWLRVVSLVLFYTVLNFVVHRSKFLSYIEYYGI